MRVIGPMLLLLLLAGPASADPWGGRSAAFFGVTFVDLSIEGELYGSSAEEVARAEMVEGEIAAALRENGLTPVALGPVATDLERVANPADCNGCAARLAARLDADYAVTAEVRKVSNLLMSAAIVVREPGSGEVVRGLDVDFRGNTDESWRRAVHYVLEHGIFTD